MHRLLLAATLGLGLLATAGMTGTALARPMDERTTAQTTPVPLAATPVHYQRDFHRPHYAPPPRHWRQPGPSWHRHGHHHHRHGYNGRHGGYRDFRYGWR